MGKMRYVLFFLMAIFLLSCGCETTPQIKAIGMSMFSNLMLVALFVAVVISLIFVMNKLITDKNGLTNEKACSIVGVIIFPLLFLVVLGSKFGFNWVTISVSIVMGGTVGYFCYALDELIGSFWEYKKYTVPATLGLILGGWFFVMLFTHVWLEGDMYITYKACAHRVIIERYTYHPDTDSDDDDDSYYSWDFHNSAEQLALGTTLPELAEGRDYELGEGARGKRDRIGGHEAYYFIGGHLYSERKQQWQPFRWLQLADPKVNFEIGKVQRVQSNFYGNPKHNAGVVDSYETTPMPVENPVLPQISVLPAAETTARAFFLGFDFLKMLFTEHEYRAVLYLHLICLGLLALLVIFVPPLRVSILIFFICASVIIFLILFAVAARTGSVAGLGELPRRRTGGGGGFGGRSISR